MVRERKKAAGLAAKAKDFKTRRAKVGKRALAPTSTTSTKVKCVLLSLPPSSHIKHQTFQFSSKRIMMPGQTALRDRDDEAPTAARGRDLPVLLSQVILSSECVSF